ncbi:MAG: leucyl aminopeptidase family protein [Pseudomonadota bacterium]
MPIPDDTLAVDDGRPHRTIHLITSDAFEDWAAELSPRARSTVEAVQFTGKAGSHAILPGQDAGDWRVVVGVLAAKDKDAGADIWRLAGLPGRLPPGAYRIESGAMPADAIGWTLGQYRFDRYLNDDPAAARTLLVEDEAMVKDVMAQVRAQALVRDLVNTPAEDMGPADLETAVRDIAATSDGIVTTVTGEALLSENFPAIHTVGRAAAKGREPRLIRMDWGDKAAPKLTIVGKGVCFDSGGLDIKGAAGMRLMKKDMGGAAHAIALASLVMSARLPVRLTLLVAAVENSVAGNAMRPGDVMATRKGLSVEIHNTDAEGRLILCDALSLACEEEPDLLLDFATLTGAARVALGPDLPALMANDEGLAADYVAAGRMVGDPVWELPLWPGYMEMLKSDIADMSNAASGGFAGAITAGLYLSRFVDADVPWAHLDTFAWSPGNRAGRPRGGEALGLRAAFAMIRSRFEVNG